MTHGTVIWVNLGETQPPEFGKLRPGLIVSNSEQNQVLDTVVVIPLSTRPPEIWPLRLRLSTALKAKPSFAVIPGIRQVSKARLMDIIARMPKDFMDQIQDALAAYLGE
jgi:mRNA interferase MazF